MIYVVYLSSDDRTLLVAEQSRAPMDRPVVWRAATRSGAHVERQYYQSKIDDGTLRAADIHAKRIPD